MAEIIDNEAINDRLNDEETMYEGDILEPKRQQVEKAKEELLHALVKAQPEPQPRVRKPRTVTPAKSTPSAKVDVGSAIQKLEEKVKLLKYVESMTVPEVPTGKSKEGREILLQIGREMEELKARKIAAITKL